MPTLAYVGSLSVPITYPDLNQPRVEYCSGSSADWGAAEANSRVPSRKCHPHTHHNNRCDHIRNTIWIALFPSPEPQSKIVDVRHERTCICSTIVCLLAHNQTQAGPTVNWLDTRVRLENISMGNTTNLVDLTLRSKSGL